MAGFLIPPDQHWTQHLAHMTSIDPARRRAPGSVIAAGVPPEAGEGLEILDEALAAIDRYYEG